MNPRKWGISILSLILAAFFLGCLIHGCYQQMGSQEESVWHYTGNVSQTSSTGSVTGVTTESTASRQTEMAGVIITCISTGVSTLSSASGQFTMTRIPAGSQSFSFSKQGYITQIITVQVVANSTTEITTSGQSSVVMAVDPDATPKSWTLFVYIAGDNSLSSEVDLDLNEMEQLGSNDEVNIVAFVDKPGINSRLYYIQQDSDTGTVSSPYFEFGTNEDSGDYNVFQSVTTQVLKDYPASHYYLDLWNHGSGIDKSLARALTRGICYDGPSGSYLMTTQLRLALESINQKFDIIACDACLMQMVENAYEWKAWHDYLVGSEESIPGEGYPYQYTFATCVNTPSITALQFSQDIVNAYGDYFESSDCTLSALSVAQLSSFVTTLNSFADAMMNDGAEKAFLVTHYDACTRFSDSSIMDIYDFATRVSSDINITDVTVKSTASAVMTALTTGDANLIVNTYSGLGNAYGLSIWGPSEVVTSTYMQCLFYIDTSAHWPAFINWINS